MRILVIEPTPGAGREQVEQLGAAGHEIARCHPLDAPSFPCQGLSGNCPIDEAPVDVAFAVRTASRAELSGEEQGVTCALRHGIPVVVAAEAGHPYGDRVADQAGDVVAVCEAVAGAPLLVQAAAVRDAVVGHPGLGAAAADVRVDVRRRAPDLHVQLTVPAGLSEAVEAALADRAATAARRGDRAARVIDVSVIRR